VLQPVSSLLDAAECLAGRTPLQHRWPRETYLAERGGSDAFCAVETAATLLAGFSFTGFAVVASGARLLGDFSLAQWLWAAVA
jgi:hypothetical protein